MYVKIPWPAVGLTLSFKFMRVKPPQNYQLYVKILRFKNQEFLLRWLTICSAFNSFWFCFYTRRRCLPADIYNALDSLLALRNSLVGFFYLFSLWKLSDNFEMHLWRRSLNVYFYNLASVDCTPFTVISVFRVIHYSVILLRCRYTSLQTDILCRLCFILCNVISIYLV